MVLTHQITGLYLWTNSRAKPNKFGYFSKFSHAMKNFHAASRSIPHAARYTKRISGEVFSRSQVFTIFGKSLPSYHGDDLVSTPAAVIRGLQVYLDQIESWFIQMDFDGG